MIIKIKYISFISILFLLFATAGCQQSSQFSADSATSDRSFSDPRLVNPVGIGDLNANGNPYEGKLKRYLHIDKKSCENRGYPNQAVFAEIQFVQNSYVLTTNNCAPISRQVLPLNDLMVAASGANLLVYKNKPFQLQTQPGVPNVTLSRGLICSSTNPASDPNQIVIMGTSDNTATVYVSSLFTSYRNQIAFTFSEDLGIYPTTPIPYLTQVPNGQDLTMTLSINSAQSIDYVFADNLSGDEFLGPGSCAGSL